MKTVMTTSTFARKLGFKTAWERGFWRGLNYLQKVGAIEIQQSGFYSHSLRHPKLVLIKDLETVLRYFSKPVPILIPKPLTQIVVEKEPEKPRKQEIFDFYGFLEYAVEVAEDIKSLKDVESLHSFLEYKYVDEKVNLELDDKIERRNPPLRKTLLPSKSVEEELEEAGEEEIML